MNNKGCPNFLIIGAQKAGTSALFYYLSRHPQIVAPYEKEINFFWQDHLYHKGFGWYKRQFPDISTGKESQFYQTFEATPHYLHSPETPKRIYNFKKDMKFIVLLREPLSRAWSQFQMYQTRRKDLEGLKMRIEKYEEPVKGFFQQLLDPNNFVDFESALLKEKEAWEQEKRMLLPGLYWQGLYAKHLRSFFRYFDPQQFFLIESETLKQHPALILKKLEVFLDLPPFQWEALSYNLVNEGQCSIAVDPKLKYVFAAANEALYQLINQKFQW